MEKVNPTTQAKVHNEADAKLEDLILRLEFLQKLLRAKLILPEQVLTIVNQLDLSNILNQDTRVLLDIMSDLNNSNSSNPLYIDII